MQPGDSTLTSSGNLHGLAGVDANAQSRSGGMLERVSAMELKIYGHPVTNRSLVQRIKDLETKVLGSSPTNPNEDMTTRVNQLWVSVNAGAGSQTGSLAGSPSAGSRQTAQTLQPFGAPNHSQQWSSAYAGKGNHNSHSGSQYSGGGQYNNSYNAGGNFNNGGSYSANSYTSNSYSSSPSSSDPNSSSPFSSNSSNNGYAPPFMANNSSSNNQFGKHKHKHSGQHGSFLGKIGKVVVFAGSAAVGASGLAVGAMSNMGGGYYGMGMGSGFGSPYSYATPSYSGFSNYGSVSSIGGFGSMSSSFGSPFGSAYSGSFSH